MASELTLLLITATSIALIHTLVGPDHYLPFIAMGKARSWSLLKTLSITSLCGLGHVGSSILIGTIGISLGIAVGTLENLEGFRGNIAGWAFIIVGLVYLAWAVKKLIRKQTHEHKHMHKNGISHDHSHSHNGNHLHVHSKEDVKNITPWILFTVFVLGPCEPLIPILIYPAAKMSLIGILMVVLVFSIVTITTMVVVVGSIYLGVGFGTKSIRLTSMQKYAHVMAGMTILFCGVLIQVGF
jgi:sulfite exporter TauE/SafE